MLIKLRFMFHWTTNFEIEPISQNSIIYSPATSQWWFCGHRQKYFWIAFWVLLYKCRITGRYTVGPWSDVNIYGWSVVVSIYDIIIRCASTPPPSCVASRRCHNQQVSCSGMWKWMWLASTFFQRTYIGQAVMVYWEKPNTIPTCPFYIWNCVVEWLLSCRLEPPLSCRLDHQSISIRSHKCFIATIKQQPTVAASELQEASKGTHMTQRAYEIATVGSLSGTRNTTHK